MRIGLISDTHVAWEINNLPPDVMLAFAGVDLILHAGDIYAHRALDDLERVAPVYAALGDDDYASTDPRIKRVHILNLEGKKIWLLHEGPYTPITPDLLELWCERFITPEGIPFEKPDIIISGHEHVPLVNRCDGMLHINPGSATLPNYKKLPGTIAILELTPNKTDVEIVQL